MSESVTLKSYFYEVLIPSSQKNTSSPIEDILHHVSISFMKKLALYKCFNPRTHTGCDISVPLSLYRLLVSIHAPTRGATPSRRWEKGKDIGFNPRTHTGCDVRKLSSYSCVTMFQSTHPHGVRQLVSIRYSTKLKFQSTHPHGVRLATGTLTTNTSGFNPRTHTGCDKMLELFTKFHWLFQSTHPHGVRLPSRIGSWKGRWVSIHAPTRGATK